MKFFESLKAIRSAAAEQQEGVQQGYAFVKREHLREVLKDYDHIDYEMRGLYKTEIRGCEGRKIEMENKAYYEYCGTEPCRTTVTHLVKKIAALETEHAYTRDTALKLHQEKTDLQAKLAAAEAALVKLRGYNVAILNNQINYRPADHIQVIDAARGEKGK